jgi:hypothetical protein
MKKKTTTAKKLLVASIGVASVSFVIGCERQPPGNLAGPSPRDGGLAPTPAPATTDSPPDAGKKEAG